MELNKIIQGDCLEALREMPDNLVDTIITSPPYWALRDYGVKGQIGLEPTLEEFLETMLGITKELKRVLKKTGVMFWNHGDCYCSAPPGNKVNDKHELGDGLYGRLIDNNGGVDKNAKKTIFKKATCHEKKYVAEGRIKGGYSAEIQQKCLMLQNWRLILKMIDEQGWILRNTIIWNKPNHMPSSVKDRFANSYEPVYMLVKSRKYWFDLDAVRVPHQYPDDVARRIRQDREDGIMPFAKDNKKGIAWRRDQLPKYAKGSEFEKKYGEPWDRFGKNTKKARRKVDTTAEFFMKKGKGEIGKLPIPSDEENPKGKNPGDVWKIPTQPFSEAHFATFPERLVEPMILSSCPSQICEKCGKIRERITETTFIKRETNDRPENYKNIKKEKEGDKSIGTVNRKGIGKNEIKTLGWTDCHCGAGFNRGIVLDPFMGSGTVAVVAKRHNRNYLGIELSKEYIKIAKERIKAQAQPLF